MKRIFTLLVALLPLLAFAQVKFTTETFEEVQKKAQAQGKCILVDVCRSNPKKGGDPNKDQIKQIFADKELAKFINSNFILMRVDMNNPENRYFGENLHSLMYPCVCFYTANGVQLESTSWFAAAKDGAKFRSLAEKSLADAKIKAANTRKIEFSNLTFEEAIAKAKAENKLVFIDAYTPWCRPCKQMELHVFSLNKVADYFNQNFICVKYDFHKDRPDLAKRFAVRGYPSYIFVNGDTAAANVAGGYMEADKIIAEGEKALRNAQGMTFTEGSWADILKKAQEENKMIFMDCYTTWCGPCKMIARTVFKDPAVAAYMNENFINVKVDMEKGEGIELKDKMEVKAFPTLLFISAKGEVEHRIVGAVKSPKFIQEAQTAIKGEGLNSYVKKYEAGANDTAFLKKYISVLGESYENDKAAAVAKEYFAKAGYESLTKADSWAIFKEYVVDPFSPAFTYFFENQAAFVQKLGEKEVSQKISRVFGMHANSFVKKEGKTFVFDQKGFDSYIAYLKSKKVANAEEIRFNALLNAKFATEDWKGACQMIDGGIKKKADYSLMALYNWAMRVDQKCKDAACRKSAAAWVEVALKKAADNGGEKMWMDALNKLKTTLSASK